MATCQTCWANSRNHGDYFLTLNRETTLHKGHATFFYGDIAEFTGRTEDLHGRLFYEIVLLEGHEKGQSKLVRVPLA